MRIMFRSCSCYSSTLVHSNFIHVLKKRFLPICTQVMNKTSSNVSKALLNTSSAAPCGQPTSATHPHLLENGELLPGLKTEEFVIRRKKLMNLLFNNAESVYEEHKHIIVIISAATKTYMTEKIPYIFRQNTDFLYVSGCLEPDTALVMSGTSPDDFTSSIFVRKQDAHSAQWDGPRTGTDVATKMFAVDQAYLIEDLRNYVTNKLTKNHDSLIYYDAHNSPSHLNKTINSIFQKNEYKMYQPAKYFLHNLRLVKSPSEQKLMRQAGKISAEAIKETMKITKPGMTEHQLFAKVDYEAKSRGAEFLAYPPVVAAGNNATVIHYINNNQLIKDGDLILMDAGCEYHGYCGDITRTWPANGRFTNYQKILYEIVLEVQKQILKLCGERMSLDYMYLKMINLLGNYLVSEKIIKKDILNSSEINQIASNLCPHRVSHYLGMDVHDVTTCQKNLTLLPGTIVTVEPGIYVSEHNNDVPPEFWKIGIRIEDDVLITDTDYEVLSAACPKEIDDIENTMKER